MVHSIFRTLTELGNLDGLSAEGIRLVRVLEGKVNDILSEREIPLRDHFAGQALQGYLSREDLGATVDQEIVEYAYEYADIMLQQRKKGQVENG